MCSCRSHFSLVWQQTIMITVFSCLVNWFEKKLLLISDISYEETRQQHDLTRMLSVISIKVIIHKSRGEVSHLRFMFIRFYTCILHNFLDTLRTEYYYYLGLVLILLSVSNKYFRKNYLVIYFYCLEQKHWNSVIQNT